MSQTAFSFETSLPPYREIQASGGAMENKVVEAISQGYCTLYQLTLKLKMPQSSISGRVNDAIAHGRVKYDGVIMCSGRKRKRIVLNK